ncbi:MAG: glycine--tRNA ligase [SAR202 cluster bacterium]|nr:glycine--tRNA ligase [SAR202 cluster bacterium]
MDKILSLAKRRGFFFQSSEIYGGLNATWDYGPLGAELKRNVKDAWWRSMVYDQGDDFSIVGLDSAILMHPKIWEASGHVQNFTDPLVECKSCHQRFRADQLEGANCPNCGAKDSLTDPRQFNLMFKTFMGAAEDTASQIYLRPETAQGIFVNFQNVQVSARRKLPFGIAQIGKAFRNEITPGNSTFRTREFEQMELEFFVKPGDDDRWLQYWRDARFDWYVRHGIRPDNLRLRRHDKSELAHYAKDVYDIEYNFPWGWAELEGIANRTDFDLRQHEQSSGQNLKYFDESAPADQQHFHPYVIEPSGGVDRAALAFLIDSYQEQELPPTKAGGAPDVRALLRLHRILAPTKVAVLPLSRNEKLTPTARQVHALLRPHFATTYDDAQSIGRRYRRQDEVGTPFCVTIDFDTLEDKQVTLRDRDTMAQLRLPIATLLPALRDKLDHGW